MMVNLLKQVRIPGHVHPGRRSGFAFLAIAMLVCWPQGAGGQVVTLTSSDLPILIVDTRGVPVPDEPKIAGWLRAIDNGPGQRNRPTDPANAYDGDIGIELRGSTSLVLFDKKSFALETRLPDGSNNNVALLGLPVENDWVLHGPYSDKTLIRNALTFELYRRMGRYASRVRFCELVVNGDYLGAYALLERVKRDNDRVDIAGLNPDQVSGDAVSGGYIIKVDKYDGAELGGWFSSYPTMTDAGRRTFYQYHYPRPSDIAPEQESYIRSFVDEFEAIMSTGGFADPETGYTRLFDRAAAVDYILLNELSGNVDAYRLSTFLYKDRDDVDGRLVTGPPWDYNIAWGNANYYEGERVDGLRIRFPVPVADAFHGPFWWDRLLDDSVFTAELGSRWAELRSSSLSNASISATIDSLSAIVTEAQVRNFARWPILGEWIWPNVVVTGAYASEVNYLKSWIFGRLNWLDANLDIIGGHTPGGGEEPKPTGPLLGAVHPNPGTSEIAFTVAVQRSQRVRLSVFDAAGHRVVDVANGFLRNDQSYDFEVSVTGLASGVYFIRLQGERDSATRRFAVLKDG